MNAHDRYDELAVGHALDALEPSEEADFLGHLPTCSLCRDAVVEHRETLGHLSYAVASEEPPAAVLEGIRAGIGPSSFPAPVSSLAEHRERTGRVVRMRTALVGVAASVVLVAALAVGLVSATSRNSELKQQDLAFSRAVSSLLTPGAQRVELTPAGGKGKVVAVVHGGAVDLVMSGVSTNDASHSTYVLWQQASDRVSAAGTFDVRSDSLTVVSTGLRVSDAGLQQLMITRESGRVAPPSARGAVLYAGTA